MSTFDMRHELDELVGQPSGIDDASDGPASRAFGEVADDFDDLAPPGSPDDVALEGEVERLDADDGPDTDLDDPGTTDLDTDLDEPGAADLDDPGDLGLGDTTHPDDVVPDDGSASPDLDRGDPVDPGDPVFGDSTRPDDVHLDDGLDMPSHEADAMPVDGGDTGVEGLGSDADVPAGFDLI